MKIIFFHHAGGDQYAFLPYRDHLDEMGWDAVYYELPGHGDRFNEPLLNNVGDVLEDVWSQIEHELTGDYILFGNSMGSLIAYMLLHRIEQKKLNSPRHFFAASRMCPASYPVVIRKTDLTHEEFWEMIREYGGASDFIDNVEFRSMFEPILRACDRYSQKDQRTWSQHFAQPVSYHLFDAGHFFVYENPVGVLEVIQSTLSL